MSWNRFLSWAGLLLLVLITSIWSCQREPAESSIRSNPSATAPQTEEG